MGWFNNRHFAVKIILGFSLVIVVFAAAVYFSWLNIKGMQQSEMEQENQYQNLLLAQQIISIMNGKYSLSGDLLINNDEKVLEKLTEYQKQMSEITSEMSGVQMGEDESDLLQEILKYDGNFDDTIEKQLVPAWRKGDSYIANKIVYGTGLGSLKDRVNYLSVRLMGLLQENITNAKAVTVQRAQAALNGLFISLILAVIAVLLIAFMFSRALSRPLKALTAISARLSGGDLTAVNSIKVRSKDEVGSLADSFKKMGESFLEVIGEVVKVSQNIMGAGRQLTNTCGELESSIQQVAASAEELSAGTEEQQQKVQTTEKALTTITGAISNVNEDVVRTTDLAQQARAAAQKGSGSVDNISKQMYSIYHSVDNTAKKVQELSNHSGEIGKIISAIADIAAQTNLLALNAAIEAARAGEQGRGFAVVAEEVRKLAEQSVTASEEIAALINGIQTGTKEVVEVMHQSMDQVKQGGKIVDQADSQFKDINSVIENLAIAVSRVGEKTTAIKHEVKNIETVMQELSLGSQQNAGASQEVAASAEQQSSSVSLLVAAVQELDKLAEELNITVGKFILN